MRIFTGIKRKLSEEITLTIHLILLTGLLVISSYINPKSDKEKKSTAKPFLKYEGKIRQPDSLQYFREQ